jgi:hypothetical protein
MKVLPAVSRPHGRPKEKKGVSVEITVAEEQTYTARRPPTIRRRPLTPFSSG